jgi:glycosyltransferase involved in cell wall biosynthesis
MKIGFDVSQTCPERAGGAWYADALARALARNLPPGDELHLYHQFGDWINGDTERGTVIDSPQVKMPFHGIAHTQAEGTWRRVAQGEALPGAPDIVQSNNFHTPLTGGAPLVVVVYDLVFWTHPEFTTERNRLVCQGCVLDALVRAAGFIFLSQFARDEFEGVLPGWLKTHRYCVIPAASRFPIATDPRAHSEDAPWLMVGSVEPRKNHSGLLDAYALYVSRSRCPRRLLVAGGQGWKSEETHRRMVEFQPAGLVCPLGYVDDTKLRELYDRSFALLAPSWHEGFGLPVVEAMSRGVPVIASRRGALPEVGGRAAIYIDPAKPGELAEAMLALENDCTVYAARATAALEQGSQFSWDGAAGSVRAFYKSLLS